MKTGIHPNYKTAMVKCSCGNTFETTSTKEKIEGIVNRDVPLMVERALEEANPLYPVPKIADKNEMFYLYQIIQV